MVVEIDVAVTVTHEELVLAGRTVVMFDVGIETVVFVILKGWDAVYVGSDIIVEFKESGGMLDEGVVGGLSVPFLPIFVGVPT